MTRHFWKWLSFLTFVFAAILQYGCGILGGTHVPLNGQWRFAVDSTDRGMNERWFDVNHSRDQWNRIVVPSHWSDSGRLDFYDGIAWYATQFDVSDSTEDLSLFFEGVDDAAAVWLNGYEIGSHEGYNEAFSLRVAGLVKRNSNVIVVRVEDLSGPGGIHAPVSLIATSEAEKRTTSALSAKKARSTEPWAKGGVIYELYPRSFSADKSFRSIEERLGDLRDLGVAVLWLMPIHPVGELNRKGSLGSPYAVADYMAVNSEFGTLAEFKSLVNAAHRNHMKVIIDLVANHTAWDNRWLVDHPDWYTHNADGAIVSPNEDWSDVADLNYDSHELRKAMIEVMKYWVKEADIDGYRCDVAEMVPTSFWEVARREIENTKPVLMLAEGSLPEHHVDAFDISYAWNTYDLFDRLISGRLPASSLMEMLRKERQRFPEHSLRLRFSTNHDKNAWDAPAALKFGPDGSKLASVVSYTLPGVPLLYNGEEAGNTERLDLFEAVPIDWTRGREARSFYRLLGGLRTDFPWLADGPIFEIRHNGGKGVLAFVRRPVEGTGVVIVVLNFGKLPVDITLDLPEDLAEKSLHDIIGNANLPPAKDLNITLPARGFAVYARKF